ncbi:hypothetical protein ACFQ2B_24830 [Streptomyces stramineus]
MTDPRTTPRSTTRRGVPRGGGRLDEQTGALSGARPGRFARPGGRVRLCGGMAAPGPPRHITSGAGAAPPERPTAVTDPAHRALAGDRSPLRADHDTRARHPPP